VVGFAGHHDFDIDVLVAYRLTGKGRVECHVLIVRDHVLSARAFSSIEEVDAAFATWVPRRLDQIHKTHREVIGIRAARDHAALEPLPPAPPARTVRPRRLVDMRATKSPVMLHATISDSSGETLLPAHARAVGRGAVVGNRTGTGTSGPPARTPARPPVTDPRRRVASRHLAVVGVRISLPIRVRANVPSCQATSVSRSMAWRRFLSR
jgi:hypothetical protein